MWRYIYHNAGYFFHTLSSLLDYDTPRSLDPTWQPNTALFMKLKKELNRQGIKLIQTIIDCNQVKVFIFDLFSFHFFFKYREYWIYPS